MVESGAGEATRVVPLMRYRDLKHAIAWLSEAFGFEPHYTASDDNGELIYAQMTYGRGMVMLGPVRDSDFDDLLSQPDEIGGTETQSCYLVVEDIESHYERAKEAGAEIALDVQRDDTGGRAYSCRDCEGHLWNFGTFNPWQSANGGSTALSTSVTPSPRIQAGPISMARSVAAVCAGVTIAGVAIGAYSRYQAPTDRISNVRVVAPDADKKPNAVGLPTAPVRVVSALRKTLQDERAARKEAEHLLAEARRDLAIQTAKSQDAVATTRRVTEELSEARGAEQAAIATAERLRDQHLKEMRVANASVDDLQRLIDEERRAKDEALKAIEAIKYELVLERQLRQQAERRAKVALQKGQANGSKAGVGSGVRKKLTTPASKAPVKNDKTKVTLPKKSSPVVKTQDQKVTAVETPAKAEPKPVEKVVKPEPIEAKPKPKPKTKRRVRRKVQKKPVQKKPANRTSNGISKGWPYNTW